MPTRTGQRRRPHLGSGVRRTGALLLVAACAACALAGPAHADQISDKRAQIQSLEQQLQAFDIKLEASIQAYDGARQHLSDVRHQIQQNTIRLKVARHNLAVARANLSRFVVSAYKGTSSTDDTAAYVLASGSFSDLVSRVEYVQRVAKTEKALVGEIDAAEHEIAQRQAQLKRDEAAAAKLVAKKQQEKAAIEDGLHQRQQLLASAKGDLGRLIHEREVRQRKAAAAAAAALARQQQEQQQQQQTQSAPPTTTSGGGDTGGSTGGTPAPPPAGTLGQQAAAIAQQYLGVPYVWGGASPSGFDCSGLVVYVYGRLGISLPHYTVSLWSSGAHVSRDQLAPGDLVFFYNLDHVGIYIGGGLFIHAPHTGTVVQISSLSGYYGSVYDGAVRITG
jgi:peptidoglycan DL-endopeptidase CwlO